MIINGGSGAARCAALVMGMLLAAGCAGGPNPQSQATLAPATSSPPPATSQPPPAQQPNNSSQCVAAWSPQNINTKSLAPVSGQLGLSAAAAGQHTGFDRVTFTLGPANTAWTGSSAKVPGYHVQYVTNPTSPNSGNPVAVTGSFSLRVIITRVGTPVDTGVAYPTNNQFTPTNTVVVKHVVLDSVSHDQFTGFIGVSAKKPFRVGHLNSPPRVYVDVKNC